MENNRVTVRLNKQMNNQIKNLMKEGKWFAKSDLIREAIWIGLKQIQNDMNKSFREKLMDK